LRVDAHAQHIAIVVADRTLGLPTALLGSSRYATRR